MNGDIFSILWSSLTLVSLREPGKQKSLKPQGKLGKFNSSLPLSQSHFSGNTTAIICWILTLLLCISRMRRFCFLFLWVEISLSYWLIGMFVSTAGQVWSTRKKKNKAEVRIAVWLVLWANSLWKEHMFSPWTAPILRYFSDIDPGLMWMLYNFFFPRY